MSDLAATVARDFSRQYQKAAEQIRTLAAPLSNEQLWSRPYVYGNSAGHLLLHLTGNLNYYIGAQIAQTGYVRNRDLEFTDSTRLPKEEVLRRFDNAIAMVVATLEKQAPDDWGAAYTAKGMEDVQDRFTAFLRCVTHLQHHAAQIIYLCKQMATRGLA